MCVVPRAKAQYTYKKNQLLFKSTVRKVLKKLDKIVSIKMERDFESLNVSAVCAILCDMMR